MHDLCKTHHMYAEVRHKAYVGALSAVTRPDVSLWYSVGSPATLKCSKGHIRLRDASTCVVCLVHAASLRATTTDETALSGSYLETAAC